MISSKGYKIAEGVWDELNAVVVGSTRWALVSQTKRATFFVSTQSIRQEGIFRQAWVTIANNEPDVENQFLSARELTSVDCANERAQTMAAAGYSGPFGSGERLNGFNQTDSVKNDWRFLFPDTSSFVVMKYICDYKLPPKSKKATEN